MQFFYDTVWATAILDARAWASNKAMTTSCGAAAAGEQQAQVHLTSLRLNLLSDVPFRRNGRQCWLVSYGQEAEWPPAAAYISAVPPPLMTSPKFSQMHPPDRKCGGRARGSLNFGVSGPEMLKLVRTPLLLGPGDKARGGKSAGEHDF